MTTSVKTLSSGAALTCLLHDKSKEMPNMNPRPAVLVFPGGGYMYCSDREAEPVALAFMAEGYNAFILRYTVSTENPEQASLAAIDDANEAMAYIHANADELSIDKNRLAVIGFSAGGHLAANLSVSGRIRPCAAVLGYPAILYFDSIDLCAEVDKNTPPTFIFTTRDDSVTPVINCLKYADALDKANVPFEMHIYAKGTHGLSLAKHHTSGGSADMVNDDAAGWFGLCVRWLNRG